MIQASKETHQSWWLNVSDSFWKWALLITSKLSLKINQSNQLSGDKVVVAVLVADGANETVDDILKFFLSPSWWLWMVIGKILWEMFVCVANYLSLVPWNCLESLQSLQKKTSSHLLLKSLLNTTSAHPSTITTTSWLQRKTTWSLSTV